MKKSLICCIMFTVVLFSCNKTNGNNNSKELNEKQKKVEQLLQKIKLRTKRDLKRLGIKKILLSNNGVWQDWTEEHIFKKDGRLLMLKDSNISPNKGVKQRRIYLKKYQYFDIRQPKNKRTYEGSHKRC